jgi:Ca2+-binding EF-hand superfamily protein
MEVERLTLDTLLDGTEKSFLQKTVQMLQVRAQGGFKVAQDIRSAYKERREELDADETMAGEPLHEDEFVAAMSAAREGALRAVQALRRQFEQADSNQSGNLDEHEISQALYHYYRSNRQSRKLFLVKKETRQAMECFDTDGNGSLCFLEFCRMALYSKAFKFTVSEGGCHIEDHLREAVLEIAMDLVQDEDGKPRVTDPPEIAVDDGREQGVDTTTSGQTLLSLQAQVMQTVKRM